jgi:hypothetical protein
VTASAVSAILAPKLPHRRDIGQADRSRPARTVFGGQRAVEDRPAVVDLTEPVAVRDADVAVVRDVGALTVDRAQAPDLDAENFDSREEIVEAVIALCDCSEKITRQIAVSST